MDLQMEPIVKYKTDRNGSAKAAWRNMVDQDLDDVAFLAESDKAREARELRDAPVAVCSQRRALCLAALVLTAMFATALIVVYATPQPDCPCAGDNSLIPGQPPTDGDAAGGAAKERIATNGQVFPWRGARLPTFVIPKHYSLWLHPNLTTGEMRGEVSIDFKVDRDTTFVVLNVRDMNVTERALFKTGGGSAPKILKTLEYPQADQTYIEFKDKLRRKFNYTLSLRFITKLDRGDKQRGFFMAGAHKHRCAISRFWLTHARSAFPCLDEPNFRASFKLTIVRDRFHVSLTNMPIVATEEAGFYLGHRLLQDEFASTPPMSPHMMSVCVCRLQRKPAPPLHTDTSPTPTQTNTAPTGSADLSNIDPDDEELPPPEISIYSDKQVILDESGPLLEWVQKTIQMFAFELNTSYPLPKLDIVVVESNSAYSEGWGLITLSPATLGDTKTIARLLAQQWFGGLVSPRWWSSQWLMEALTSVLGERVPAPGEARGTGDALLLDHVLPALRLDSSYSVRAVASPRLEIADIEAATDELSLHKGAAIVSMAIEAAGEEAGRAALARLLRTHRSASADARDLWRSLQAGTSSSPGPPRHAWDGWSDRPGYPLLTHTTRGAHVTVTQERFVMSADPPEEEPQWNNELLTLDLRSDLDTIFYEPENFTEIIGEDDNSTTTTPFPTTTTRKPVVRTTKPPPPPKWVIPVTFIVGPLDPDFEDSENATRFLKNISVAIPHNGTWYDLTFDNKTSKTSRWKENVTHLVWMNDTEMIIPDLGKHKWVRYNVGARGLYRVAPQDIGDGETTAQASKRATAQYEGAAPAERALILDDLFVLSTAGRLPASRAIAAAARLRSERHWSPWRVALSHLSQWRQVLARSVVGPLYSTLLRGLHPPLFTHVYTLDQIRAGARPEDQLWLSGALLTAGVEWENREVTKQAVDIFDSWYKNNQSIPDIYQEAAFTSGVRTYGQPAWQACWKALVSSYNAPRPLYDHKALLVALASPVDDWLFYRFAWTTLSSEAQRSREWKIWVTALCTSACRWRGASGAWRILRSEIPLPPSALQAAAKCLTQPQDYYQFKKLFGSVKGSQTALDLIALNVAWVKKAEPDLLKYFNSTKQ